MSYTSEGTLYALYFVMMLTVALCYTGFSIGCMDILNFQSASLLGRQITYQLAITEATRSNTVISIPQYCGLTPHYYIQVHGDEVSVGVQSLLTGWYYRHNYNLPNTHISADILFNPSTSTRYFIVCNKDGELTYHDSNHERPYLS